MPGETKGGEVSLTIEELVDDSYTRSVRKGWYDNGSPPIPERLALIHSEVSEALESHRNNEPFLWFRDDGKPEGIAAELADVYIRIADMCGQLGIDLEEAIRLKAAYNETRPHRHGGKVC